MHLIKERIQPERAGSSWLGSIIDAQREIESLLEDSPSLQRHMENSLQRTYRTAVNDALRETQLTEKAEGFHLPHNCPFTVAQLLEDDPNTLCGMLK